MTAHSHFRGHETYWDEATFVWRYSDNGGVAGFYGQIRPCKACGRVFGGSNTGDPDPGLGTLPGVDNACCGHGVREKAYIRFTSGVVIRGFDVVEYPPQSTTGEGE